MDKVIKVDDLNKDELADVVNLPFALDGVGYRIDLTAANAEKFREAMEPWVRAARPAGKVKIGAGTRKPARLKPPTIAPPLETAPVANGKSAPRVAAARMSSPVAVAKAPRSTDSPGYRKKVRAWAKASGLFPLPLPPRLSAEVYAAYEAREIAPE